MKYEDLNRRLTLLFLIKLALCPPCPLCGGSVWRDGLRRTNRGFVQRYICRSCFYRFSESSQLKVKVDIAGEPVKAFGPGPDLCKGGVINADFALKEGVDDSPLPVGKDICSHELTVLGKSLNTLSSYTSKRRLCVSEDGAKKLAAVEPQQEKAYAGATTDTKGLIIRYLWHLKKQGYKESTIRSSTRLVKALTERGADLLNPESVKRVIASQETWSEGAKANAVDAYSRFLTMEGLTWEAPRYRKVGKLPFIPLESEIDQLIAGCGEKVAAFLQGLKETGADPGELWRVEWTDVDAEKKVVTINHPVKGHNPRILPVSDKWINMIARLPKTSQSIFGDGDLRHHYENYSKQRRKLATRLGNTRLHKITFTTFRHWKATIEYHKTKDVYHVKRLLGHKRLTSTEVYINLEEALFQSDGGEFHVKVAEDVQEACRLIEAGFDYVGSVHGSELFRKRK